MMDKIRDLYLRLIELLDIWIRAFKMALKMHKEGITVETFDLYEIYLTKIFNILKKYEIIDEDLDLTFSSTMETAYFFSEDETDDLININFFECYELKEVLEAIPHELDFIPNLFLSSFFHELGHFRDKTNQTFENFYAYQVIDEIDKQKYHENHYLTFMQAQTFYQELPSEKIAYFYGLDIFNEFCSVVPEDELETLLAPFQKS